MKRVMMTTHSPKKRKILNLKWKSITKNSCVITKVKKRFNETLIYCPIEWISRGKILLGTNQLRGPHEYVKANMNMHISTTTNMEYPFYRSPCSSIPNFNAKIKSTGAYLFNVGHRPSFEETFVRFDHLF